MHTWFGLAGPPGMPPDIVARLDKELAAITADPAFQDRLAKLGMAVDFKPAAPFASYLADDTRKWRELIPAMGIPQVD
jgi:tripartite-type tricarboxylate transporter receptor subunit TctC